MAERRLGIVRHIMNSGRTAFLQTDDDVNIFLSVRDVRGSTRPIKILCLGDRIEYTPARGPEGKGPRAIMARVIQHVA